MVRGPAVARHGTSPGRAPLGWEKSFLHFPMAALARGQRQQPPGRRPFPVERPLPEPGARGPPETWPGGGGPDRGTQIPFGGRARRPTPSAGEGAQSHPRPWGRQPGLGPTRPGLTEARGYGGRCYAQAPGERGRGGLETLVSRRHKGGNTEGGWYDRGGERIGGSTPSGTPRSPFGGFTA